MTVAVYKSGYMLESLADPTLPVMIHAGDNAVGAGNQQGRPDEPSPRRGGQQAKGIFGKGPSPVWNPQRLYAGPSIDEVKIQSELLGD